MLPQDLDVVSRFRRCCCCLGPLRRFNLDYLVQERTQVENLLAGIPETLPESLLPNSSPASSSHLQSSSASSSTPGHSPSSSPHIASRKAASTVSAASGGKKSTRSSKLAVSSPSNLQSHHQNDDVNDGETELQDGMKHPCRKASFGRPSSFTNSLSDSDGSLRFR